MAGWRSIIFDLDGTLLDSRPGIFAGLHHALEQMGYQIPAGSDLDWAIGPPLVEVLARLLSPFGDPRAEEAAAHYRQWYGEVGLFDAVPYPGIPALVECLTAAGKALLVCTSKRTSFAQRILDHFNLARHFRVIQGSEAHGKFDRKTDLLAHVLQDAALSVAETVMVGDREHDVHAARAHGLEVIGVTYGYGSREELLRAGAHLLCDDPAQLQRMLL